MVDHPRYKILLSHQAKKDVDKIIPTMKKKLKDILEEVISVDPYEGRKLMGDLQGSYSYRLTYKDRILYAIDEKTKTIYILRARTHHGE